jgi:hypothetical protein
MRLSDNPGTAVWFAVGVVRRIFRIPAGHWGTSEHTRSKFLQVSRHWGWLLQVGRAGLDFQKGNLRLYFRLIGHSPSEVPTPARSLSISKTSSSRLTQGTVAP